MTSRITQHNLSIMDPISEENLPDSRTGGEDAFCFTAGPKGAVFSAGVIHALLVADRRPPLVAAGISVGALSSAALQYSYRALEDATATGDLEVRRWSWFRRYFSALSDAPQDVIWRAIPDPVDFFARKPPVEDLSCPPGLKKEEAASRRHYYILTKLGVWLGHLPVRVNTVAEAAISFVRWKERYGLWVWRCVAFKVDVTLLSLQVLVRLCCPPFFSERTFSTLAEQEPRRPGLREFFVYLWWRIQRIAKAIWAWRFGPLFGWRVWILSWAAGAWIAWTLWVAARVLANAIGSHFGWAGSSWWIGPPGFLAQTAAILLLLLMRSNWKKMLGWMTPLVLDGLDIRHGLLHDYHLHRRLLELFGDDPVDPKDPSISATPLRIILVAMALQEVTWKEKEVTSKQVWAEEGAPLTESIRAALCLTGLFRPLRPRKIGDWVDKSVPALDLVDGKGISQNPVPSLFGWLTTETSDKEEARERRNIGRRLSSTNPKDCRMHVVYSVPIGPYRPGNNAKRPERINIVEAATISRELARQRDILQEALQTNFTSELEVYVRNHSTNNVGAVLPIFADGIAPETDITFANNLEPKTDEIRRVAAAGCRQTLQALYPKELEAMPAGPVACHLLLMKIPMRRKEHIKKGPGVRELCAECTGLLRGGQRKAAATDNVRHSYGLGSGSPDLLEDFAHLNAEKPRIVFLGSGGVFRGSFHIGVIGAMNALQIQPDLVVGASVGALMGGALCAISTLDPADGRKLLGDLCGTFLSVDGKVALTRTLKNLAKQLGVRALQIPLSANVLAKMIRRGGRADAGFAAVGAPPALIDAIASLFLIPHSRTRAIASEFVAGHIASAVKRFWKQVEVETLPSLDIETYLMGTSLLEPLARNLLGHKYGLKLNTSQPYHQPKRERGRPVSFFCTTSDLFKRRPLLLGRDFLCNGEFLRRPGSYDFVNATLCSSAFPAVFAPRSESQLIPGSGQTDVLLADGGMFDNLPFLPAIEVLGDVQSQHRRRNRPGQDLEQEGQRALEFLARRQARPDLLIAAALDADAEEKGGRDLGTLWKIQKRVQSLENNVKSKAFATSAERTGKQTQKLLKSTAFARSAKRTGTQTQKLLATPPAKTTVQFVDFVDKTVAAGVLQIIPTDTEHINGTFAFCRSAGMEVKRVQQSIADGCFQTFRSIAQAQRNTEVESKMLHAAIMKSRVPAIGARVPRGGDANCSYFQKDGGPSIPCPFVAAAGEDARICGIRDICAADGRHRELYAELAKGK